jgi:hypothetical protein
MRQKGGIIEKRRIRQTGRRQERDGRERKLDRKRGREESQKEEMRTRRLK